LEISEEQNSFPQWGHSAGILVEIQSAAVIGERN
jgi:hypothetical protein